MSPRRLLRRRANDDISNEIDAHIAERVDDLVEDGVSVDEARAQARREFGNRTLQIESSREVWRWRWLDLAKASLRDAGRTFRRSTGTLTMCLAVLGISTGLFVTALVIADALVWRPLRLHGIDRVVHIDYLPDPIAGWTFNDWWDQAGSLEHVTRWHAGMVELATDDGRFVVNTAFVEPAFPELFSARPLVGRTLGPLDFEDAAPVPVLINETLWRLRFKRDPGIVGTTLTLSNVPVVVVGVLPTRSAFRHDVQIWLPRPVTEAREAGFVVVRPSNAGGIYARLDDGATIDDATRELQSLQSHLNQAYAAAAAPGTPPRQRSERVPKLSTVAEDLSRSFRTPILALLVGTFAVLVMAAANTATLLLGLVLDRRQELAVRASLGAARRRLVAQMGVEFVLIGAFAGVLGGATGIALLTAASPLLDPVSPYLTSPEAARLVVGAGVGAGGLIGLVVGLVPLAFSMAWKDWSLLAHRASDRGSRRGRRTRTVLVVVQVSAAMLLLTGAGVALQSFLSANRVSVGFDPSRVLTARFMVPAGSSMTATIGAISRHAKDSGVASALAATRRLPIVDVEDVRLLILPVDPMIVTRELGVTPGFFDAMGIRIVAGRDFDGTTAGTAIVSQTLAAKAWPDQLPLGQLLPVTKDDTRVVIGVAEDVYHDLGAERVVPGFGRVVVYSPFTELPTAQPQAVAVVMQCMRECDAAMPRVRPLVEAAGGTMMEMTTIQGAIDLQLAPSRVRSVVAVAYAAIGFLLAIAGIYGLVRHVATARLQEVTIRMALGATPAQARAIVLRYGAAIVVAGIAAGAVFAWWLQVWSQSWLHGVIAADSASYITAASALAAGGVLASLGPAIRLGRLDVRRLLSE